MSARPRVVRDDVAHWAWPALIVAASLAVGGLTLAGVHSPLRAAVALPFLLLCPGMALVRLLDVQGWLMEWTLAVAVSIALETIVATIMIYKGVWSPDLGLVVLIAICLAASALQLRPRSRRGVTGAVS